MILSFLVRASCRTKTPGTRNSRRHYSVSVLRLSCLWHTLIFERQNSVSPEYVWMYLEYGQFLDIVHGFGFIQVVWYAFYQYSSGLIYWQRNDCQVTLKIDTMLRLIPCQWSIINTLRPGQNVRHFADDILKWISFNVNARISLKISLKFVHKVRINSIAALIQITACRLDQWY